ncbi:MAG TPA: HEPN domain-containing protein [Bacillota bacterium]|jgi:HEPN domain-containing protein|nr:HEPN domain-containing protein [Bacillota bacterium]HQD40190.1 HEPN domain-containing protein [Bacillota bacterium]
MAYEDDEPEFSLTCYLAQQCAEKSLKALLIYYQIEFLYKHALTYLASLLPEKEQNFLWGDDDLEWLSDWVTEGRYPGDYLDASDEDAKKALEIGERIYRYVLEKVDNL